MPRADELIAGVRDYLRNDVMTETQGRVNFLARVASNALDIVLREAAIGPAARDQEQKRLATLLGKNRRHRDPSVGIGARIAIGRYAFG